MERVGFTTTIPLEVIVAAGKTPVDLNNIFITSNHVPEMIEDAELAGFPRNVCGWIKGIYTAVIQNDIREMIAVTEGDCSYTKALMEVLSLRGVTVIPFAYPHARDRDSLHRELQKLMDHFQVGWPEVRAAKAYLDGIRAKVWEIDRLTWEDNVVTGKENHYFQVATSDMNGNPETFSREVDEFLVEARSRTPFAQELRLAYMGVPPIFDDIYPFVENGGARVVFNETQRQFSMPGGAEDLVDQYLTYTYPYDIFHRLADIQVETARRKVDGIIHYVQSFCFRQIEDMIVRQKLPLPILTLEGDKQPELDARTKIRIEGFLEMLKEQKE